MLNIITSVLDNLISMYEVVESGAKVSGSLLTREEEEEEGRWEGGSLCLTCCKGKGGKRWLGQDWMI